MSPFSTRKSAMEYLIMTDGYDGRAIIDVLKTYLKPGSSVLELGMGPGRDLEILEETYCVTGSDVSEVFIDLFRKKKPGSDLYQLDAVTIDTDRKFDCIFSNKVLHQISRKELTRSFSRQLEVLNPGGIACHTFWYGDKEIEVKNRRIHYYTESTISDHLDNGFEMLLAKTYREMDVEDSMLVIGRKR